MENPWKTMEKAWKNSDLWMVNHGETRVSSSSKFVIGGWYGDVDRQK
jgi:hypothetical protein